MYLKLVSYETFKVNLLWEVRDVLEVVFPPIFSGTRFRRMGLSVGM